MQVVKREVVCNQSSSSHQVAITFVGFVTADLRKVVVLLVTQAG